MKAYPGFEARRRELLIRGLAGAGVIAVGPLLWGCRQGGRGGSPRPADMPSPAHRYGPLGEPDANGVRLPEGFSARIVAAAGTAPVAGDVPAWHRYPDGGAVFPADDGGWIYCSNSEVDDGRGGVGALRFSADGEPVDSYRILSGTSRNCAGGPTPWGTWLSCEEVPDGLVHECDPLGERPARALPALGRFMHEAAAVDPIGEIVYLTEDVPDGGFYRFLPRRYPDLADGWLQVAEVVGNQPLGRRRVRWHTLPNPWGGTDDPARYQVLATTPFDRGEGIWFHGGMVYFTTTGDNRVWAYDAAEATLSLIYDDNLFERPILTGVDNVTVTPSDEVLVAEDGGDMQLVALDRNGVIVPVLQVTGQPGSELAGQAFTPDGSRLYVSSQRGGANGLGLTYEIRGPFS